MSGSSILRFWYRPSYSDKAFAELLGLDPPEESRTSPKGWAEFREEKHWACSILPGRRILIVHSNRVAILEKLQEAGFKEVERRSRA